MSKRTQIFDGYTLVMHAHCGMSYEVGPPVAIDDRRDLVIRAAEFLRRRRRAGYGFAVVTPWAEWELTEPETAALVPDDAGILAIESVYVPGYECFDCGFPVKSGEACDCHELEAEPEADDACPQCGATGAPPVQADGLCCACHQENDPHCSCNDCLDAMEGAE